MPERVISDYYVNGHPIKIVFNDDDLSLDIYVGEDKIHLPHWGISWSIATQLMEHAPEMRKAEMVSELVKAGSDPDEINQILSRLDEFRDGRRAVLSRP